MSSDEEQRSEEEPEEELLATQKTPLENHAEEESTGTPAIPEDLTRSIDEHTTTNHTIHGDEHSKVCYGVLIRLTSYLHDCGNVWDPPSVSIFFKRPLSNGLQRCEFVRKVRKPRSSPLQESKSRSHSVRWTQTIDDEEEEECFQDYQPDPTTDLFQVGRDNLNDVILPRTKMYTSRFSFRIVCQRDSPHKAFLYAAGFNGENEIFLGSGAITDSLPDGSTEGFVTNGVFVTFPGENPSWYEVGTMSNKLYFYSKRNQKRTRTELNNELLSGSIIAIGGENFLWLNPEDFDTLNPTWNLRDWFNDQESYCPITLSRVKFGYGTQGNAAHVYPGCGHVHGDLLGNICKCWCGEKGPIQILKYPCPSVLEITAPTHCFNPCGCAVSEETAKFWSNKTLLRTRAQSINHSPFQTCCPWCKTPLRTDNPYSILRFERSGSLREKCASFCSSE